MASISPLVLVDPLRVALLGGELVATRKRARPELRLILPTGHAPLWVYEMLAGGAADGSLSAHRATVFQLDEYLGLAQDDPRSYAAYLRRELKQVSFAAIHFLGGAASPKGRVCAAPSLA